jgi:quinol monooxygenase YgiN
VLSADGREPMEETNMREDIYWVCVFSIEQANFEKFQSVVAPLVEETKKEPGSLAYEYFVTKDKTAVHIIEHYRNSSAVVSHVQGTFSKFAEPFTAIASVQSFLVYGTPNAEAQAILDGFGATYHDGFDGFTK